MLNKKLKFIILPILFLFSIQAFAKIFIDVNEFTTKNEKGIRLIVFNTTNQKFLHIAYFTRPSDMPSDSLVPIPADYFNELINIDYMGNVTVKEGYDCKDKDGYIVRTNVSKATIIFENEKQKERIFYYHEPKIKIIPASIISEDLNRFNGTKLRSKGHPFQISFFKQNSKLTKFVEDIQEINHLSDQSKGELGELATEYTMINYGYKRAASKYGSNHGFDGVFIGDSELFLTESKCWVGARGISAQLIVKNHLCESEVAGKLYDISEDFRSKENKSSPEACIKTCKQVLDFFMKKPDKIWVFGHSTKVTGLCQCSISPLTDDQCKSIINICQKKGVKYCISASTISAEETAADFSNWKCIVSGKEKAFESEEAFFRHCLYSLSCPKNVKDKMFAIYKLSSVKTAVVGDSFFSDTPLSQSEFEAARDKFLDEITDRYIEELRISDDSSGRIMWGGDIELETIAKLYNLYITVIQPGQDHRFIGNAHNRPITLWYDGQHYQYFDNPTHLGHIDYDGNCMFNAVIQAAGLKTDATSLRNIVANSLSDEVAAIPLAEQEQRNRILARFRLVFGARNRTELNNVLGILHGNLLDEAEAIVIRYWDYLALNAMEHNRTVSDQPPPLELLFSSIIS